MGMCRHADHETESSKHSTDISANLTEKWFQRIISFTNCYYMVNGNWLPDSLWQVGLLFWRRQDKDYREEGPINLVSLDWHLVNVQKQMPILIAAFDPSFAFLRSKQSCSFSEDYELIFILSIERNVSVRSLRYLWRCEGAKNFNSGKYSSGMSGNQEKSQGSLKWKGSSFYKFFWTRRLEVRMKKKQMGSVINWSACIQLNTGRVVVELIKSVGFKTTRATISEISKGRRHWSKPTRLQMGNRFVSDRSGRWDFKEVSEDIVCETSFPWTLRRELLL